MIKKESNYFTFNLLSFFILTSILYLSKTLLYQTGRCWLVSFHKVIEISSGLFKIWFSGIVYVFLLENFKDFKPGNHFNKCHHFFPDSSTFTVVYFLEFFKHTSFFCLTSFESMSNLPMSSFFLLILFWIVSIFNWLTSDVNCFELSSWPEFPEQSVLSWTIPVPAVPTFLDPPITLCCDRDKLEYERCSCRIGSPGILQLLDSVSCKNKIMSRDWSYFRLSGE